MFLCVLRMKFRLHVLVKRPLLALGPSVTLPHLFTLYFHPLAATPTCLLVLPIVYPLLLLSSALNVFSPHLCTSSQSLAQPCHLELVASPLTDKLGRELDPLHPPSDSQPSLAEFLAAPLQLQEGEVGIIDSNICNMYFQSPDSSSSQFSVHEDMLCAGDLLTGKSICRVSEPSSMSPIGNPSPSVSCLDPASAPDFLFLSPPQPEVSESKDRSSQRVHSIFFIF